MKGGMILLHGRGASAEDILGLREEFGFRDVTYFAPEATGRAWYPYSFLAPIEQNEPWLSKSLAKVGETVDAAMRQGIAREKIVIAGFSQGACLASEFVARNTARYGRPDRSAGKRLPLPRQSRRHARVLRRGRSRCSRALEARRGLRPNAREYGRGCHAAPLPWHASYRLPGGDRRSEGNPREDTGVGRASTDRLRNIAG
jgi:hypothetical protein